VKLKLNLLENSHDFLNASLYYYGISKDKPGSLKFAIINLVQSMELMFKERLRRTHELFIYENIDKPKNTVSITTALERLSSIADIKFDSIDKSTIQKAIEWRNQIMHYEVEVTFKEIETRFAILFEFLYSFHQEHLGCELHTFILTENWQVEADLLEAFRRESITYNERKIYKAFVQEIIEAQTLTHYVIDDIPLARVKYGEELLWQEVDSSFANISCHDCAVTKGEYHVPGCDMEACPKCGTQAITCGCNYKVDDEGYIIFQTECS
jgi:hypothetical protein